MKRAPSFTLVVSLLASTGCAASPPTTTKEPAAERNETSAPNVPARERPEAAAELAAPASEADARPSASDAARFACGPYQCRRFARLEDAFVAVLAEENPRVLGVGESHAQAGGPEVPSMTARFTNQLLPLLAERTHSLVVELMAPNASCQKKTAQVREQQKEVTQSQATTNQNEFVTLGQRARSLGVVPYLLRPSCDDLAAIAEAGDDDVLVMLETIARLTEKQVAELLSSQKDDSARRMVVAYGGALHNDLEPRQGREGFSYGPSLRALLAERRAGTYVELDLIVPELIQDGPAWRAMPWYDHYGEEVAQGAALSMQLGPQRWVLFAPRGAR